MAEAPRPPVRFRAVRRFDAAAPPPLRGPPRKPIPTQPATRSPTHPGPPTSQFVRVTRTGQLLMARRERWLLVGSYAAFIGLAELTTIINPAAGLILHALLFLALAGHGGYLAPRWLDGSRLLFALTPVPLIRVTSLAAPLSGFPYLQWFVILGAVVYAATFSAMRVTNTSPRDAGLRRPRKGTWPIEVGVVALGPVLGYAEFQILHPGPLVSQLNVLNLLAPALILYLTTGLLEELVFRGFIQHHALRILGPRAGVLFVSGVFGILHVGFLTPVDVAFAAAVGLLYALVVQRTGSIGGVSVSHGLSNIVLFLLMPLLV